VHSVGLALLLLDATDFLNGLLCQNDHGDYRRPQILRRLLLADRQYLRNGAVHS